MLTQQIAESVVNNALKMLGFEQEDWCIVNADTGQVLFEGVLFDGKYD